VEPAFAGTEQHVPDAASRIQAIQRSGMGSAGCEFPPNHSTTFGNSLRSVEPNMYGEFGISRLKISVVSHLLWPMISNFSNPPTYFTLALSCVLSFPCLLHLDLYVAVVFLHLLSSLHTLVVPTCLSPFIVPYPQVWGLVDIMIISTSPVLFAYLIRSLVVVPFHNIVSQ